MATKFHVLVIVCIQFVHCCYILSTGEAATTTDPQEIEVLKTIARKMRNEMWDFSLDPCSGKEGWKKSIENKSENFVECNCTLDRGKFCHVTRILLKKQNFSTAIPSEFANLTYLEELDLTRNYLNGSIPAELGSLIYLKILSLGVNRLSGNIPKELGNLSRLETLVVQSNNLSGQLPEQLANLMKLKKLHVSSNQFSGKIPTRYSRFKVLNDFRATSNDIRGRIPEFIGNWKSIKTLRLEGTSLEGPIPSTFSGLTELKDLRLSDITSGKSNLSFVIKLENLETLVLRNSLIYGKIPSDIGNFRKLEILDLRFNNLVGSIPNAFQKLVTNGDIEYLYLGNNSLSGELQPWLAKINNVDLSYNNFSGEFPNNLKNNQMNLIGNSFNFHATDESDDAFLQRNFRCDKELQTSLAINCGGDYIQGSSTSYEQDQYPLGPASAFLSTQRNWAISNTGHFLDNSSQIKYQIENNSDNSLSPPYNTARVSPTSLRYYGLCLHKGPYKVRLHFAELVFSNDKTYRNIGRRIFDIYIQGTRVLPGFDIMKTAGGAKRPVYIDFNATVNKNYLEIHFYWAGKGTYNVPDEGVYGPLVSAIVITPAEFAFKGRNRINTPTIVGIVIGAVISVSLALCLTLFFIKKRNRIKKRSMEANVNAELTNMKTTYNSFSLEDIRAATCDFRSENKIGEGGFGAVFKGILPDGKMVAVKQMFSKSRQGNREFLNEVGTISAVQHPNLVKLWGCCIEGKQLLLVYEYLVNNSLARALFGPQECRLNLSWSARHNICLGVARGLAYLHEESRLRIVHRDIKSSNILLDKDLNPKISDFGLAKLFDQEKTHVSTRVAGTIGYMAPEYALKGLLTEKADVYSFGVVILEVVSGRSHTEKKLQEEMVYLLEWTWKLYNKNRLLDLIDINLKNSSFSDEEVFRTINVGLLCTHAAPTLRPSMSEVVKILEGKLEARVSHCQPPYISYRQDHEFTEEGQFPCSESLSMEGPSTSSSQRSFAVKKEQKAENDDNDESSLILHNVSHSLSSFKP